MRPRTTTARCPCAFPQRPRAPASGPRAPFLPATGTQYRSVVFTHDASQQQEAEAWKARLQAGREQKIVTAVEPAAAFWPAETYHQQFLEKGGQDASKGSTEPIKCYG